MKTTIDLPDALAADAKALAREQSLTLRDLVVAGLRTEVERRRAQTSPVDFHFPTVSGEGLAAGLAPGDVVSRSYDLPA